MRITIVSGFFLPIPPAVGGAMEKMWWRLARIYARRGHEVTVVSRTWEGWPERETIDGVNFRRVPGFDHRDVLWKNLLLDARWGTRVVRALPAADILVTNTVALPVFVRKFRPDAGLLVVNVNRFPKGQTRWYPNVARVQAASPTIADAVAREAPALAPVIRVTPNPIDLSRFKPRAAPHDGRRIEIGYLGRIHPEKGLRTLLRAAEQLPPDGSWRLSLRGHVAVANGGGGDAFVNELRSIAPHLWARGDAAIEPALTNPIDLAAAYRSLAIFCYPTEAAQGEANPVAVSEAMATGLPVVATQLDCFRGQIDHEVNGLLVPPGNPAALRDALARLMRDEALRARLGAAGLERASTLDDELIATQHLADYQALLDAARR
jgi:glycosyltransferase involved in cell wall biosynthesis